MRVAIATKRRLRETHFHTDYCVLPGGMMMTSRSVAGLFFVVVVLSLVLAHGSVSHEKRRQGCGPEVADGLKSRDGKSLHTEAMCCETKNNSCVAHGPRLNSPTATTCFCDADCMTNGDCCLDYAEQCPGMLRRKRHHSPVYISDRVLNCKM